MKPDPDPKGIFTELDLFFDQWVVNPIESTFFWDVYFWDNHHPEDLKIPLLILWLALGSIFFTFRFGLINIRCFGHAILCLRGKFTSPNEKGEISHAQALSAALSATVGLGNIAGVAFAVHMGGPGAILWMILAGFLGMSAKFAECALGQKYRITREDGHLSGGPMHYLAEGLSELGLARLGKVLATIFSILCVGASFGGGNMFQANQAYAQVSGAIPFLSGNIGSALFGLLLAFAVGLVIIGGIKRIGEVAGILVPFMCGIYFLAGAIVLLANSSEIQKALEIILRSALGPEAAAWGGGTAVLIQGFRRAAFSNEAGVGSAPIAHSAATTNEPIREGLVALLEPFIDTVIICTMTGLVIVVTGAYLQEDLSGGILMTSWAFNTVIPGFDIVLSVTAVLFAYSTMISWSYYGEQCWANLLGSSTTRIYKVLFLLCVLLGSVISARAVLDFGDLMLLGMAFPNIIGVCLLSGKVKKDLDAYLYRFKNGDFVSKN